MVDIFEKIVNGKKLDVWEYPKYGSENTNLIGWMIQWKQLSEQKQTNVFEILDTTEPIHSQSLTKYF